MKSKPPIPDLVSMLDPARPSPQWLQRTILRARAYLDLICQQLRREVEGASEVGDIPDYPEAEHLCRVIHWATHAERAIERGDAVGAATAAMGAIQAAWQAEMVQGRVVVADGFKKRSGDKNRAEKVIRGRKKQVDETSERHRKIYADFIKVMNERPSVSKRVIYEKLGRENHLAWGRIRNIVSEQKKAAK
ncbi:hypothetical protein [Thauera chlorobenzoica]|nr:hypothetical protein [Thauera chlorobenzoica]